MVLDKGRTQQVAAPAEAYLRPANRFVAEFLGIANFVGLDDGRTGLVRPERVRLALVRHRGGQDGARDRGDLSRPDGALPSGPGERRRRGTDRRGDAVRRPGFCRRRRASQCRGMRPTSGRSRKGIPTGGTTDEEAYIRGGGRGQPARLQYPDGRRPARAQSKEIRMIELGGASGEFDPEGLHRAAVQVKTGIKVVRESPARSASCARWSRAARPHHDAVRAGLGRRAAGQEARPDRKGRLGCGQSRGDVSRGQGRVRLRLPVFLHHHGVAGRREGAEKLHRVLRQQGVPGQALPARLSRTTACRSRCRRAACRSTSCSRSTSTSPSRS